MSSLTASAIAIPAKRPLEGECRGQIKILGPVPVGLYRQSLSFGGTQAISPVVLYRQSLSFGRTQAIAHTRKQSASLICASALNARCGAEQTQTVTRESSTITIAPTQGKEKSPELDDGGTGFPPRDDGDGGGGGGGGGGGWAGGFFFFGFLAFLGFLKDKESEGPYRDER
ncbi:hypothetical protein AAG906_010135 [Vitis piasezkii]|uniref:Uncharacterized protein n=1 Tax=Vitis vinifera TaxID=29760 RepID=A0A438ERG8_VITVI|nr:protein FERTILITY RESTORER RF2, mitochondrial isoform X1 [Vitis vinifera]RVW50290.1 hypothetical protein CK203_081198 [Vitis vinifera]|eukprot:XP_019072699.1 PREDICTED: WAS/WASL-interacting protein family member 1 isoform X1 [Vitis vinifera]